MTKYIHSIILQFFLLFTLYVPSNGADNKYALESPDKSIAVTIELKEKIYYSIAINGKTTLAPSPISLTLENGKVLGSDPKISSATPSSVNTEVKPIYGINSTIKEKFNRLVINLKDNLSIEFRAYDNGVAYRIITKIKDNIKIQSEEVNYRFEANHNLYAFLKKDGLNHYESNYSYLPISGLDTGGVTCLPLLLELNDGTKALITEADLLDYPGLYLKIDKTTKGGLNGLHSKYPKRDEPGGHMKFNRIVKEEFNYIAEVKGTRSLPWRLISFAKKDKDLLNNDLVYLLSTETQEKDLAWIKPGKVSWDWWNANNLTGVDFKTGFNTETYKYFIDFAAANGIEYVNLDEGWSDQFDLLKVTTQLDMPAVIAYAKEKKVGLFLWCVWRTLDTQLLPALDQFQKWGIAGIKVDFMDRDDQVVVNFYERVARESAKRHILVNFHGAYKPTGLRRTYPNVINREAVLGMEYNKWSKKVTPEHDVTLPFIRMAVGPMDFTPGAMINATKDNFNPVFSEPMSQGTRCHQLAMYAVYYAPLQMMADAPTNFEKEPKILKFLSQFPTVWDETVPLDGKVGDYVVVARRKGTTWYIGAMTDWTPRKLTVDLSFLNSNIHEAEIFADGINADRNANDYKRTIKSVKKGDQLELELAPGGGWAAIIKVLNK